MASSNQTTFVVKNMRAVGMHHHGPPQLTLNANYRLVWEPECIHDLGNAIAICNSRARVQAYLTRKDAAVISDLFFADILEGTMLAKTSVEPHCVEQKLGPQQECSVKFKVLNKNSSFVELLFNKHSFTYEK